MVKFRRTAGVRDLLAVHRAHPQRYPYLLQSSACGGAHARYDILFGFPQHTLELASEGIVRGRGLRYDGTDFLAELDSWWSSGHSTQETPADLPFTGGWFVYLGYELAAQIEPRLRLTSSSTSLPAAFATRIPAALIQDHHSATTVLVAESDHAELLDLMSHDIATLPAFAQSDSVATCLLAEDPAEEFLEQVRRTLRYILDGDVFQVNVSRGWRGELSADVDAAQLYHSLRMHNPAPFAGLAVYGTSAIISSSPERLVKVRNGIIETRPIAGTRPRDRIRDSDLADTLALINHPKERAEHIMLIDLERNDMGRVCLPGSITVNELMGVESYAHVHHIVSNVRGTLRPATSPGDVLRAVFPGGTITGCPKVRCMEIIAELEQAPRGAYTGSMGYLNRDGSMDMNILIRTMVKDGQAITLRAGAGIVADSNPARELLETCAKARAMLSALGMP